jgi:hypothetical protein
MSHLEFERAVDDLNRPTGVTQTIVGLTPTIEIANEFDAAGRRTSSAAIVGVNDVSLTKIHVHSRRKSGKGKTSSSLTRRVGVEWPRAEKWRWGARHPHSGPIPEGER